MTKAILKAPTGPLPNNEVSTQAGQSFQTKAAVLQQAGLTRGTVSRWESIADLPEEIFEQQIATTKGEVLQDAGERQPA